MAFQITTQADSDLFVEYQAFRDRIRSIVAYGVYPYVKQMIAAYDELEVYVHDLEAGTTNEQELADYDDATNAAIAETLTDLLTAADSLIAAIEAIETTAPNTFGIVI